MKRRIYRAMLTLALGSVVLFALLSLLAAYFTFAGDYKERLDNELSYMAAGGENPHHLGIPGRNGAL